MTWAWQSAIMIVLVWCVIRFDRRNRPSLRYRLWTMALVCVLLLPWAPRLFASVSWIQELKQSWTASKANPFQPSGINGSVTVRPMREPSSEASIRDVSIPRRTVRAILPQLVGWAWLAGGMFAAARRLRAHIALRYIVKRGGRVSPVVLTDTLDWPTRGIPSVVLSPEISAPMLYGWFDPVILLPQDIMSWSTPAERLLMIRHEYIHYERRDYWTSAVEAVVRTALFFHPLVYLGCRQLAIEREFSCDERMLQLGVEPQAYGETLVKVAEHALVAGLPCESIAFSSAAALNARVERLFRPPVRVTPVALVVLPSILLFAALAALGFSQASAPQVKSEVLLKLKEPPRIVGAAAVSSLSPSSRVAARVGPPPRVPAALPQANAPVEPERLRVKIDQLKQSEASTLVLITVQAPYRSLVFVEEQGILRASGRISTTVTSVTGQVASSGGDDIRMTIPRQLFKPDTSFVHQSRLELTPGLYKLDVVLTDEETGNSMLQTMRLQVQSFPQGLSTSLLILAERVEALPTQTASSVFQIGNLRVLPSVRKEFTRDQDLSFAIQVYGLTMAPATIETSITLNGGIVVRRLVENVQGASDMTMTKTLPLDDFEAGDYSVLVTVTDTQSGETTSTKGEFRVR